MSSIPSSLDNIMMYLPTSKIVVTLGAIGVAVVVRSIKRAISPIIKAELSCRCGKVQGEICAKAEDSVRLHCYCKDCRTYANAIANLDTNNNNNNKPMVYPCGETHLVQVCKSGVSIHKGQENLKLARQAPDKGMFRYYADCCKTPIMNTIDFLGFVGVFEDNLDDQEREKFYGPVCYCTKEAAKTPLETIVPDLFVGRFIWNVLRYTPWAKAGPFDYTLQPIYWGETKKEN